MTDSPDFIQRVQWMLNLFENDNGSKQTDYRTVYRYNDGNGKRKQVTLGRGFTEDGGNLRKVVDAYLAKGGTSTVLRSKATSIGKGTLAGDAEFVKALRDASEEQAMKDAQDAVFKSAYLDPALRWADASGFKLPLSSAVVVDSYLHSGRMVGWLIDKFSERTPANGGDEKRWIEAYLTERKAWFTRVSGALHTCIFRPKFFLDQIRDGNWLFECPLNIPEKGKIC